MICGSLCLANAIRNIPKFFTLKGFLMNEQEKIDCVISAIEKAKEKFPRACITLVANAKSGLDSLGRSDTVRTLNKLEKEERILHVYNSNPGYVPRGIVVGGRWVHDKKQHAKIFYPSDNSDPIVIKDFSICIRLYDNFENWLTAYHFRKNQSLTQLSKNTIQGIYELTELIKEKFETNQKPTLDFITGSDEEDYLAFFKNKAIIDEYTSKYLDVANIHKVQLRLNIEKFLAFIPQINNVYEKCFPKTETMPEPVTAKPISISNSKEKTLYTITYNHNNEILLNGIVLIGKPTLNGENNDIFAYLMAHPNLKITRKELADGITRPIGKDLPKVVENLGFKQPLKDIFFHVSNEAILFRNPITKAMLDDLHLPPLRTKFDFL